jgi:hypothetical protein
LGTVVIIVIVVFARRIVLQIFVQLIKSEKVQEPFSFLQLHTTNMHRNKTKIGSDTIEIASLLVELLWSLLVLFDTVVLAAVDVVAVEK